MSRIIPQLGIIAFLLIISTTQVMADTTGAHEFTVLYSNNVNGETEPCG